MGDWVIRATARAKGLGLGFEVMSVQGLGSKIHLCSYGGFEYSEMLDSGFRVRGLARHLIPSAEFILLECGPDPCWLYLSWGETLLGV